MLIVTGMSGAGKSVALHTLEDLGYYCVDNLPLILLDAFVRDFAQHHAQPVAVAIDARNAQDISALSDKLQTMKSVTRIQILFLNAQTNVLARRFSESRRPHPLRNFGSEQIIEAIEKERKLLGSLNNIADMLIDTSNYRAADLRQQLMQLLNTTAPHLLITLQSFGFKHGIPVNADFVFDVRFLPNPYWEARLRAFNGKEQPIIDWLEQFAEPRQFAQETANYLQHWLSYFTGQNNRAYLNIAIGCTGGQHRSVFIAESVGAILRQDFPDLHIEHRDIEKN